MKSKKGRIYSGVLLDGKNLNDDLRDCLTVSCTNMKSLAEMTDIEYDRLVYVFTRLGRPCLLEGKWFIICTSLLYKGKQSGGLRNKGLSGYNRSR
jgi:hypothetical protein